MSNKVVNFPASSTMQPDQAMASAEKMEFKEILIVGYDADGNFMSRSSGMTKRDALWLLELAKKELLG